MINVRNGISNLQILKYIIHYKSQNIYVNTPNVYLSCLKRVKQTYIIHYMYTIEKHSNTCVKFMIP